MFARLALVVFLLAIASAFGEAASAQEASHSKYAGSYVCLEEYAGGIKRASAFRPPTTGRWSSTISPSGGEGGVSGVGAGSARPECRKQRLKLLHREPVDDLQMQRQLFDQRGLSIRRRGSLAGISESWQPEFRVVLSRVDNPIFEQHFPKNIDEKVRDRRYDDDAQDDFVGAGHLP